MKERRGHLPMPAGSREEFHELALRCFRHRRFVEQSGCQLLELTAQLRFRIDELAEVVALLTTT
jgi:hypothetical protein